MTLLLGINDLIVVVIIRTVLCVEIQNILAQSMPKQFTGECKQSKI